MLGWNRKARRGAKEAGKGRRDTGAAVRAGMGYSEGNIQLEIKSFESFRQINRYTSYLSSIKDLRIMSESWSEEEGFKIIVSMQMPMALASLLRDMPEVARVQLDDSKSGYFGNKKDRQKAVVELKTTEATPEPVLV
jgi:hypothetical protein